MIVLDRVEKTYGDGVHAVRALRGVDLRIEAGEFVAVCGPSGSGKSTILHIMGLLDRPTRGRYLLDGIDVTTLSDRERSRIRNKKIGFVFQSFHLLPRLSAVQNVMLPLLYGNRPDAKSAAQAALAQVDLSARRRHRPGELSGGEEQRVAIARALVKQPEVILADEPTGNLDSRTGMQILDILTGINEKGVTLVIITHDSKIADRAGRVIETSDGRIVT